MDPIYELIFYSCILLFLIIIYNWIYGNEPKTISIDDETLETAKL
jgi:hypothetical protein